MDKSAKINKEILFNCESPLVESKVGARPIRCGKCPFETKSTIIYLKHRLNHHNEYIPKYCFNPNTRPRFQCDFCFERKYSMERVLKHVKRKHTPDERRWLKCDQCDFKTYYEGFLTRHQRYHHDPNYRKPKRIKIERHFKCEFCDYQTTLPHLFKSHMLHRHTPDDQIKWLKCDQCAAQFKNNRMLSVHKTRIHVAERRFKCDQCDYKGFMRFDLVKHQQRAHEERTQVYKCEKCDAEFDDTSRLSKHRRKVHTQKTNELIWWQCEHCTYKSTRSGKFKMHCRSHNS